MGVPGAVEKVDAGLRDYENVVKALRFAAQDLGDIVVIL